MKIPKALIHIKTVAAVEPTEEQLLEFFKPYGYSNLEDVLKDYINWQGVIREWYVNTNYTPAQIDHQVKNNIFRFESDNEEEEVELIDDEKWEEYQEDDLIF